MSVCSGITINLSLLCMSICLTLYTPEQLSQPNAFLCYHCVAVYYSLSLTPILTVLLKVTLDFCSPHDLKVMTSDRDFRSELTSTQNLTLALGLSQRTVLLCSHEFIENDLKPFESALNSVIMSDVSQREIHQTFFANPLRR